MELNKINTVIIDLNLYNELRDFKENYTKKNTVMIMRNNSYPLSTVCNYSLYNLYITESVALTEAEQINKSLNEENEKLKTEIYELRKENILQEVRKMGFFRILRWWFDNRY